jgi:flagellar assembly factor FliW|uniref:Flagellar assembly factor FliW n=1 Tax=Desulfobacca acetoxidans TaxID=60893 RepID=A0A7C5AKH7_9BACT
MAKNFSTPSAETSTMSITTRHFGVIQVRPDQVILLEPGLLGFGQYHRYILIEHQRESPFLWLQCLDNPDLAFVVTDPLCLLPEYRPPQLARVIEEMKPESPEDMKILVILTIPPGRPQEMTANLMGPVVIDLKRRRGRQIVVEDPRYSHKYRVLPEKV